METKNNNLVNKLSFFSLVGSIFLSLFFFIPYLSIGSDSSKGFIVSIGITLSLFFWLVSCLSNGKFSVPKDNILWVSISIPLVFLIASLFSSSSYISLFSSGFEIGTFGFILLMSFSFLLSSIYFQETYNLKSFFIFFFLSALIVSVVQLLYVFLGGFSFLSGFFAGVGGNIIGSWNDFALYFGLVVIVSIFTLEFVGNSLSKIHKWILYSLIVVSLLFLMLINIPFVWLILGIFSVIIFVYGISSQTTKSKDSASRKIPVVSLSVMIVSILFLIGGSLFGGLISRYVSLYNPEIRPSVVATGQVAVRALSSNPFFGVSPNNFSNAWSMWKPSAIMNTQFWNTDFSAGSGFVPTMLVTSGILGFASILVFIAMFLVRAFKSFVIAFDNNEKNYYMISSLIIALYGWIYLFIYNPGFFLTTLTFVSTGVFIGSLVSRKIIPVYSISFLSDPRKSFFSILSIVVFMILCIAAVYIYTQKILAISYFSRGLGAESGSVESLVKSERMFLNAISLDQNDIYYRALSQIYLSQLGLVLSEKNISEDVVKSRAQSLVSNVEQSAGMATTRNPNNYQNWMNLGNAYSTLMAVGVEKAYDNAISAYDRALELSPNNPSILLAKARLEFSNKDTAKARSYIKDSLDAKGNYLDAIFTLAQIEKESGNIAESLKQFEYATTLYPGDYNVFYQLGLARYNNADYRGAVGALETSVILNNTYANSRYLLGMAYSKSGRVSDAKIQFNILDQNIPNNEEIKRELDRLNADSQKSLDSVIDDKKPAVNKKR